MIALGIPVRGSVDPSVLIQWITLLRTEAWLGPVYAARDVYPAKARNKITEDFLNGPADKLFMFDSDQLPPLFCYDGGQMRSMAAILESQTEPVVCGLVFKREPPYHPVAYTMEKGHRHYLTPGRLSDVLRIRGVVEIDGYGSGSMLLHRRVLEHMKKAKAPRPIWEADPDFEEDEGWKFFDEIRALGYKIWLDTRIEAAHLEVRPITHKHHLEAHGYQVAD